MADIPPAPDWTNVSWLVGDYNGVPTLVAVDDQGRLYAVLYGTISVAGEVDVNQLDSTREVQGSDEGDLHTIAVDNLGRIITLIKGIHDGDLTPVAVDGSGQLYALIKGSGGEDIAVDESGYITAILKGIEDGTLRTIAVDTAGRIINVIRDPTSDNYVAVDEDGNLTSVMKGLDGATLRTVAVDENGNIVGVLKGAYDSTLKTLACDSEGHLLAVLTDPEDVWGVFRQMGLAELATRLGGVPSFDRRGDLLQQDSFEDGLCKGFVQTSGTGGDYYLSTESSFHKGVSLALVPGSDGSRYAELWYYLPYPHIGKVAIQASFTVDQETEYIVLEIALLDGTTYHRGLIEYDAVNHKIRYYDSGGSFQDLITNVNLYEDDQAYHTMKMVIDLDADEYVRVMVDGYSWTTGGLALYTTTPAPQVVYYGIIKHFGSSGNNPVSYIDGIVFTQNEEP